MNDKKWLDFSKYMKELFSYAIKNGISCPTSTSRTVFGEKEIKFYCEFKLSPIKEE